VLGIITRGHEWTVYISFAMLAIALALWFWTWWDYRDD
jgi:hypothetical protein